MAGSSSALTLARVPMPTPDPVGVACRQWGWRDHPWFRFAASLHLALVLLSLFAGSLVLACGLGTWYGAGVAQQLVYRTFWFRFLLVCLASNVLAAVVKKYPWRWHQVGFLITHAGLLVLFAGGMLTSLGGTQGEMVLLDTPDRNIQERFHLSRQADSIQLLGQHRLEVFRVPENVPAEMVSHHGGHSWSVDFRPGGLPWYADEALPHRLPLGIRLLQTLADPFPGWSFALDGQARCTIHNYYPHTEQWPFSPAQRHESDLAGLRIRLTIPSAPAPLDRWLRNAPLPVDDALPLSLTLMTLNDPALLSEFLDPPPRADLGKEGQLVLLLGPTRQRCVVDLDQAPPGQPIPLPGTNLTFTCKRQGSLLEVLQKKGPGEGFYPTVLFELARGEQCGEYLACARLPGLASFHRGDALTSVSAWYHHPDGCWGEKGRRGALHFLRGADDRLYYRVFTTQGMQRPGRELDPSVPDRVIPLSIAGMEVRLSVTAWLPHAFPRPSVVPKHVPLGAEPAESCVPGLHGSLAVDGQVAEFRIRQSGQPVLVQVGKSRFLVRYRRVRQPLGFSVKLLEARKTTALVRADGREQPIALHQPLVRGSYTIDPARSQPLTDPATSRPVRDGRGRPVHLLGLTVGHEPGRPFLYVGSILLVAGMATVFCTRAYPSSP
jgi:hypothetical protein